MIYICPGLPRRSSPACAEHPLGGVWPRAKRGLQDGDCSCTKVLFMMMMITSWMNIDISAFQVDPAAQLYQGAKGDLHQREGQPHQGDSLTHCVFVFIFVFVFASMWGPIPPRWHSHKNPQHYHHIISTNIVIIIIKEKLPQGDPISQQHSVPPVVKLLFPWPGEEASGEGVVLQAVWPQEPLHQART